MFCSDVAFKVTGQTPAATPGEHCHRQRRERVGLLAQLKLAVAPRTRNCRTMVTSLEPP